MLSLSYLGTKIAPIAPIAKVWALKMGDWSGEPPGTNPETAKLLAIKHGNWKSTLPVNRALMGNL